MRRLPEPEAVIIAIVDDDPWGAEGAAAAHRVGGLEPETLSIFSVMRGKSQNRVRCDTRTACDLCPSGHDTCWRQIRVVLLPRYFPA